MRNKMVVRAIGWSSLGFAAAAWLAPDLLGRALGVGERRMLVRVLGTRDLVVGLGLVAAQDPKPWLRARFASDVGDAVLHAAGALTGRFRRGRTLLVATGAAGVAAVDFALLTRDHEP